MKKRRRRPSPTRDRVLNAVSVSPFRSARSYAAALRLAPSYVARVLNLELQRGRNLVNGEWLMKMGSTREVIFFFEAKGPPPPDQDERISRLLQ